MKKYLVLITCFLSDLAILCEAGTIVLLPADYTLPESKEGYPKKFKYLGTVEGDIPAGVDPEMIEVEQVLKDANITKAVADAYYAEVGASTPAEKLVAAKELAADVAPEPPKKSPTKGKSKSAK